MEHCTYHCHSAIVGLQFVWIANAFNKRHGRKIRKGTKPEQDVTWAEVDLIKGLLFSTIEKTKEDYNNNVFETYNEYTVTTKSTLTNVDEAIDFNNFHEGIHLGYILALKRAL